MIKPPLGRGLANNRCALCNNIAVQYFTEWTILQNIATCNNSHAVLQYRQPLHHSALLARAHNSTFDHIGFWWQEGSWWDIMMNQIDQNGFKHLSFPFLGFYFHIFPWIFEDLGINMQQQISLISNLKCQNSTLKSQQLLSILDMENKVHNKSRDWVTSGKRH